MRVKQNSYKILLMFFLRVSASEATGLPEGLAFLCSILHKIYIGCGGKNATLGRDTSRLLPRRTVCFSIFF